MIALYSYLIRSTHPGGFSIGFNTNSTANIRRTDFQGRHRVNTRRRTTHARVLVHREQRPSTEYITVSSRRCLPITRTCELLASSESQYRVYWPVQIANSLSKANEPKHLNKDR